MPPRQGPDAASAVRLRARIVPTPGCFYFVGALDSHGYGVATVTTPAGPRTVAAHRLAAHLAGLIPSPEQVLQHECNERICCRIGDGHLTLGTQADNIRYAVAYRGSVLISVPDRANWPSVYR